MKLATIAVAITFTAVALAGQVEDAAVAAPNAVAVVNGDVITAEQLDTLYRNLTPQMRNQYDAAGGKKAFLENYIAKRLLLQEAAKSGFEGRPEVQQALEAARESALFDRYVRDVVAAEVVPDSAVRAFYEKNVDDFVVGDSISVRHIVVGTSARSPEQAQRIAGQALAELRVAGAEAPSRFAEVARRYSEDATSARGGDLGWVDRERLDKAFAEVAFALRPGTISDVFRTQFGYHVILVDDVRRAGVQSFDEVRRDIREYLLSQKQSDIIAAVSRRTDELRRNGRVETFPARID
ncbi:MAG TPA: peptidylprolyl isomerase [Thermoanaerobaculia bacterium]|nr:peptidylprolyl isomerase [Thermoanaerobaculia bacterium]